MHVHHAHRNEPQSTWGCGRHSDTEAQITLRRKALLEVAAAASGQTPTVSLGSVNAATAAVGASSASDSSTYDLAAMRRQKGSVSILTQDGDTVQIRFRTREGLAVQSNTTASGDGSTSSTSVYAFASGRVQVEVNGELDTDELKAIGDLMDKVDSLAAQFFEGDTEAAFSAASELGFDAGEIAGFALRLSVKEFARASFQAPAIAPPAEPSMDNAVPAPIVGDANTGATEVAASGTSTATPVPVEASTPAEAPDSAQAIPAVEVPAPPVAANPAPTADPQATLQQSLGNFLKQVLDGLASVNGAGRAEFSMRWKLQVMIQAVQSAPAANAADPAATQLATDALGKLASAQA
jgi:hypothetical protein